ncbi:MAG: sialidase family protein [Abditibacteriaceae bacterium]
MTFTNDVKGYYVGLRIFRDDGKSWQCPFVIDTVTGAYTFTLELSDRTILVVYYEEGEASAIRARRFRMPSETVK